MTDISYESMHIAMEASGYKLKQISPQGSRLYVADGKLPYRVAHFEPNDATAAWMKRGTVHDARVLDSGEPFAQPGELPEFGLESTDDYHSDTSAISKSMLSVFAASPLEYYHQFITGLLPRKKPSKQMKIGTAVHAMLLEKKTIDEACVSYPYSCYVGDRLSSAKAKSFDQKVSPLVAVREDDMRAIQKIVENAKAGEFGKLLELHSDQAVFEKRIDAEIEGIPCKCRPDLLILLSDQAIICDLKVGVVKPDDFWRNAKSFGYSLQASHYSKIVQKEYGLPVTWRFWALESTFPYRVEPYWYEDRSMEIANDAHRDLLRRLKKCYDTGNWSDNFEHEKVLNPWDVCHQGESVTPEELSDATYEQTEYTPEDLDM